jgi:hypothetical protein
MWKVDDAATRELMVAYYRALLAGAGRSEALRQVQLAMMQSKNYSHPYYWASFVVVGEDAPLRHAQVNGSRPGSDVRGPRGCACDASGLDGRGAAGAWLLFALVFALTQAQRIRRSATRKNTRPVIRGRSSATASWEP